LALSLIEKDQVLVIGGCSDGDRASIGEIMAKTVKRAGGAGIVVDGLVRDATMIRNLDLPVYCTGITPKGLFVVM
jgi:regulator of RNase E activity RraA